VDRHMAGGYTLQDVREQTYKSRDAWWTVFLVDPLASRLVKVTANRTRITPNQLTLLALLLGLVAAGLFWWGEVWSLALGAVVYHFSFVLDCMDGKIARLKGTGSILGSWLDYVFDRIRVFLCALALFGGQYRETDEAIFLVLATVVVFLDMLRYMDALQIAKVRRTMNQAVAQVCLERGIDPARWLVPLSAEEKEEEAGTASAAAAPAKDRPAEKTVAAKPAARTTVARATGDDENRNVTLAPTRTRAQAEMQSTFSRRFGWYLRLRDRLVKHRVRPHVFSGIEYQMFIFIVAPLGFGLGTWFLIGTTIVSASLLLLFELAIIYKLVLSTRDLDRLLTRLRTAPLDTLQ
jgi:phosphatidylglycerophosphate synthase